MTNVAVITAFTPDMADQFQIFVTSLRKLSKIPLITVILDDQHNIDLNKYDCIQERLNPSKISEYRSVNDPHWVQWFKPEIIKLISEKYDLQVVLWLDVDIVILNDISPIVLNITDSFTVMKDYFAPASTLNAERLYDLMPSDNLLPELPLNSGVVGFKLPRDVSIIEKWIEKCKIAVSNKQIKECISLYDQGALIWALKDLNLLDIIVDKPEWNHCPIRNAYDVRPNKSWPCGPKSMGGDLYAEVAYDNPDNTIIAHYAGIPKITNLLQLDHPKTLEYIKHYQHARKINRKHIFVVGLERAGTHTIAEILRKSSKHPCWIRHESAVEFDRDNYLLCQAALDKFRGLAYDREAIQSRIHRYNRHDVCISCDSNHRLAFFIDEIKRSIDNSQFILMLRSPIQLLKSKIFNYSIWPSSFSQYPLHYQMEAHNIVAHLGEGSASQNFFRLYPQHIQDPNDWHEDIIYKYVWEITQTIDVTMKQLSHLAEKDYLILWLDDLPNEIKKLKTLIGAEYLNYDIVNQLSRCKFGSSKTASIATKEWVDSLINENIDFILSEFTNIFDIYGLQLPNSIKMI